MTKDTTIYKLNTITKDSIIYRPNIKFELGTPEVVAFAGIDEEEAQKIKSEVDSIEINEDDRLSKSEKEKIIFNIKKEVDSKQATVSAKFPDDKKEIVCLLVWEVKEDSKKLLAIFNNGGGVKISIEGLTGDIKVCSYISKKKKQKFSYSKKLL